MLIRKSVSVVLLSALLAACDPGFPPAKPTCSVVPHSSEYGNANKMGMTYYSSLEDAQLCAASTDRKILAFFTGYATMSSADVVWEVVRADRNRKLITEQYVFTVLYVDDKDSLPAPEIVDTDAGKDTVYTIGMKNSALEQYKCRQNSQPVYVVFDDSLNVVDMMGYSRDIDVFEDFLRRGILK